MVFQETISVRTNERMQMVDLTGDVQKTVLQSGISNGIVMVCSPHTTAGITINENADPDVTRDILWKTGSLVPHKDNYFHGEGNSDSHVKATLVGFSVQLPVKECHILLGTWQAVYFCEFDGPRRRQVMVTVLGEK